MLNNLGNVSLYLISMANIARFLGFSLRLVCFVHGNNVFLSLFACSDVWNGVSCCFLFRLELETMFLASFYLLGRWRRCFGLLLVCGERRNRVSWFPLDELGGETRFLDMF